MRCEGGSVLRSCISALLIFCFATMAVSAVEIQSLLVSGGQAPGAPAGANFSIFNYTVSNNLGEVSFRARLSNGNYGIWSTVGGGINAVAIQGMAAPVTPATNYSVPLLGGLSDSGSTGFTGVLTSATQYAALFKGPPGSVTKVARIGDRPMDLPVHSYFTTQFAAPFNEPSIIASQAFNASGQTAFFATAWDEDWHGLRHGIWSDRTGQVESVAITGAPAAGFPSGSTYYSIVGGYPYWQPRMNDHGGVAFLAGVLFPDFVSMDGAIFGGISGTPQPAFRISEGAPGTIAGTSFWGVNDPDINNLGNVAFHATIVGPDVTNTNDSGIWSNAGGTQHMVAREGNPAPGTPGGTVFSSFDNRALINGTDQTFVSGRLTGPAIDATRDSGAWMEQSGILQLVFQEGMQVPGLPAGTLFRETASVGYGFAMNALGTLVFHSNFVGTTQGDGLFASDALGNLSLILRSGQQIEVTPGVFKTISYQNFTEFSGGDDGGSPLNDADQISVLVGYTDGSQGVLLVTIPEPLTGGLALALLIIRRRPRNR